MNIADKFKWRIGNPASENFPKSVKCLNSSSVKSYSPTNLNLPDKEVLTEKTITFWATRNPTAKTAGIVQHKLVGSESINFERKPGKWGDIDLRDKINQKSKILFQLPLDIFAVSKLPIIICRVKIKLSDGNNFDSLRAPG